MSYAAHRTCFVRYGALGLAGLLVAVGLVLCPAAGLGQGRGELFPSESADSKIVYGFSPFMQVGFAIRAPGSKSVQRLTYSIEGTTNLTLAKVGDRIAAFGAKEGALEPNLMPLGATAENPNPLGKRAVWTFHDLEFSQSVQVVGAEKDTCILSYDMKNNSTKQQQVSLRFLLDVFLVDNDAPFFVVPGQANLIATKAEYALESVPPHVELLQIADRKNPGLRAFLNLKLGKDWPHNPARFLITRLPPDLRAWDIEANDMRGDGVAVVYWGPFELSPGQSRKVGLAYGLSLFSKRD